MYVYGNWSAYDELSDGVRLTEDLAMKQMRHLERMRAQGVHFDAYLMDAFWYDPSGGYRTWRKDSWPDGPDRWFQGCKQNDLLPGLWFTANTLFHLDLPREWEESIDARGWGLCCFQGGFMESFIDTLRHWYERGVRIFKLDFADFGAVPKGLEGKWSAHEVRERNITAYLNALKAFRKDHPEAIIMGFNGFDHRECMDRSDNPPGDYISPRWLEVLDSVYAGDPRPADLPANFWRSVNLYADCMTRLFESSGIPLARIDNCGFMCGPTGTCYWRGKAHWQESLLLSFARGGNIHVAYGDLSAFDDDDARWWAIAQKLFGQGETSSFGGWPSKGECFGWHGREIATIVNPGLTLQEINLPHGNWDLISTNQIQIPRKEDNRVELWPEGIAVYAKFNATEIPLPKMQGPLTNEITLKDPEVDGTYLEVLAPSLDGPCKIVITQSTLNGRAMRQFPGDNDQYPIRITVHDANGSQELPPMVERKIWSGISWAVHLVECDRLCRITVTTTESRPCRLAVHLFQ